MVAHCLILSRLDTLQLKRDRLDGPLMTRMMFWLCKEREISRSNHRSRHMSCHRRQNNPCQVSSKDPLGCHEAGGAPWLLETCCDMGQNDTIGKIELNPSFVLSSDETNCKNDIQLFHQLFDEISVNRDYH